MRTYQDSDLPQWMHVREQTENFLLIDSDVQMNLRYAEDLLVRGLQLVYCEPSGQLIKIVCRKESK